MEGEERVEKQSSSNDVVVVISGEEEGAKVSEKSEDSKGLEKAPFGSYSFSKYLTVEPPIAQLSELQIPTSSKTIPTTASTSAAEIPKLSPTLDKSNKLGVENPQSITRRRSIGRTMYSKPKSRLVEPSYPITRKIVEEKTPTVPPRAISPNKSSPNVPSPSGKSNGTTPRGTVKTAPVTPRTPLIVSLPEEEDDDEEDDDVYKTGLFQVVDEKKESKKWKKIFLIELIAFVCIMIVLVASLTIHRLTKSKVWSLEIWKWSVLVLVIFCGRLVTEWCSNVLVFLFERNYFMKKKVLYFVYSLKKSVRVFIWLGLVLLAWALLINRGVPRSRRTTRILNYITRALASSLIGAAMWMLKTLVVKLLASSFHVKRFFDRIQESLFHQYVLQTLSGPPLMEYAESTGSSAKPSGRLSFKSVQKGKQVEKQEVVDVEKLHKIKREKVSAWTMGGLIQLIRTSGLSTISDTLEESVDDEGVEQKEKQITSKWEAKAAAYRIFKNVAKPRSKHIDEEDLLRFMNMEEVDNVLPLFEGAVQTGKIKKLSFCNWVIKVYHERKYLAHSLDDAKTAIEELNKIVTGIISVVIIIVWMVFEGLVFVFIMHPFDVGDRCVIDGIQMVVEEMNILTTIFLRYDNEKIFYPNSVLATKPISNFNRSPEMHDSVEFSVDDPTSAESIAALKAKIKAKSDVKVVASEMDRYLESKPQHWRPEHSVQVKEIEDVNKMKMVLYVTHTINFQNSDERSNRKAELVFELKKIFEEIGIKYHLLPQEKVSVRKGLNKKEKQITSEWEAKAAAYRVFTKPHSITHIDVEDLLRFMNMEEVNNVLPLFEGAVQTGETIFLQLGEAEDEGEEDERYSEWRRRRKQRLVAEEMKARRNRSAILTNRQQLSDSVEFAVDVSTSAKTIVALEAKRKV
ncbi:hypothetical protein LguiA_003144 [Lonicera macranthoides]